MSRDRHTYRLLIPQAVRDIPGDLAVVALLVCLTCIGALIPGIQKTPLRAILAVPTVLFLPGYAVVAALFPERDAPDTVETEAGRRPVGTGDASSITVVERVVFSVGISLTLVPIFSLVLSFTPVGIRLAPVGLGIAGFTIGVTSIAVVRRLQVPLERRFRIPCEQWVAAVRTELHEPGSRADVALNVVLVCSVILAVGSIGFVAVTPTAEDRFTEFYLLGEANDGDPVAGEYPTELTAGGSEPIYLGVSNEEHREMQYSIVVLLQRTAAENGSTGVTAEAELDRFETPVLSHGESWRHPHSVTPTMTGDRLRLRYLLYVDEAPADPSADTADERTHLWVNVSAS